jgi:ABC-2 type transport system permease protein
MKTYLMLIRREFWEHRSLWIAPLVWVGILTVLFAWFVFFKMESIVDDSARAFMEAPSVAELQDLSEHDRQELQKAMEIPEERMQTPLAAGYFGISGLVSAFVCIVVFFYLIDCLFAERRDRSILFWKSLPVSDTQVVLSKLLVALVVVPLGVIALSAAMQLLVLGIWSIKWSGTVIGQLTPDWNILAWLRAQVVEAGVMLGGIMWYAPIAAYFLLLSVWVRKLVILWAVVPLVSVPLLEWFFTGKHHVAEFIGQRFGGYWKELNLDHRVFTESHDGTHLPSVHDVYDAIDISGMFTSAEAWIGIAAAAAMTFLAIRVRRYRDDS